MGMNKSKGNMYSFIDYTWNTIKGACPHGCSYCYMKRWGEQPPLHFDSHELLSNLGIGKTIFVGSSCDVFARNIPEQWILDTLNHCSKFDNRYLFQSKNPERMKLLEAYPQMDVVVCTTIETNRWYNDIMGNTPSPLQRAYAMMDLPFSRYVTIEPIMDFDVDNLVEMIRWFDPIQVNIGADSGNNHLPEPPGEKVLELIERLKTFTVIDQKRNLGRLLKTAEQ